MNPIPSIKGFLDELERLAQLVSHMPDLVLREGDAGTGWSFNRRDRVITMDGSKLRSESRNFNRGLVLHEMAHAVNIAKGVKDCDSNGRHNKHFKTTAEGVFNLTITEDGARGWSGTEVTDECAETWGDMISRLDRAISLVSCVLKTGDKEKKRNKNLLVGICSCAEDNKTRASAKRLAKGIRCEECEELFVAQDNEGEEG